MKFITALILTALLGYAGPLYFPWWSFAITSLIVSIVIHQSSGKSFVSGFLGLFLLWAIHVIIIDNANEHLLSKKVAHLLPFNGSSVILILVTAILGGLVSGLAALTGSFTQEKKGN